MPALAGALAYRNATGSTGASAGAEPFANESYDRTGYHDNSTNIERLTIPSGVSLVRVVGTLAQTTGNVVVSIRKGGASFPGSPYRSSGVWAANVKTGPLVVSAGEYFELWRESSGSQTYSANYNNFAIEALNPWLSYAFVNKTGTQSIPGAFAATNITWDNDVVNVGGGWHSTVTNNSRLTVPVGVTRVRVTAGSKANASTTNTAYLVVRKNGAGTAIGLGAQTFNATADKGLNVVTAILEVTGGTDYFEIQHINSSAMTIGSDRCWASIEDASGTVACMVSRSSNQAIAATTWTKVQWNSETFDDASMHDNSTNPTRLTVPAGYSQARVSFCCESSSTEIGANVLINGAVDPRLPIDWSTNQPDGLVNGLGPWIDINPAGGDYFEVEVYLNSAANLKTSAYTWACLEVR